MLVCAVTVVTVVAALALGSAWAAFGPRSVAFAFVVVWVPMVWMGTVSRVVTPRLPASVHRLRAWERNGSLYTLVGVTVFKRLLRRGPLAVFNPGLHLPAVRSAENLAILDQRMRAAEASHFIVFALTVLLVVVQLVARWWTTAGWTMLFNVVLNGYPVMLQRYNRGRLARQA